MEGKEFSSGARPQNSRGIEDDLLKIGDPLIKPKGPRRVPKGLEPIPVPGNCLLESVCVHVDEADEFRKVFSRCRIAPKGFSIAVEQNELLSAADEPLFPAVSIQIHAEESVPVVPRLHRIHVHLSETLTSSREAPEPGLTEQTDLRRSASTGRRDGEALDLSLGLPPPEHAVSWRSVVQRPKQRAGGRVPSDQRGQAVLHLLHHVPQEFAGYPGHDPFPVDEVNAPGVRNAVAGETSPFSQEHSAVQAHLGQRTGYCSAGLGIVDADGEENSSVFAVPVL